jgi:mannose-6-phosphate isomerase-like protein (cupin superfamily)
MGAVLRSSDGFGNNGGRVTTVIDLTAELAKLTMLQGRTPQTTSADRMGSSVQLAPYRDGALFTTKFSGEGAWERHMKGDELVHVLDGSTTLDIVVDDGPPQSLTMHAGMVAIVPQGAWHRFRSSDGVTVMTATPLPTDHIRLDVDDPRTVEPPSA